MSALGKRMSVEFFTATSRITGTITTHHIHVRDELNDTRRSMMIFDEMSVATLSDLRAPRVTATEGWLHKEDILLAVPYKIKGTTSALTQRSIQSRLGKNEHRILLDLPPFRVEGNFYFVGKFHIQDALRRDQAQFMALNNAQIIYLPDPSISFVTDELAFNREQVKMLCSEFEMQ